jgi:Ca-activated chloride channel homolog
VSVTSPQLLYGLLVLIPVVTLQLRSFFLGRRDLMRLGSHLSPERLSSLFIVKWFLSAFSFDVFLIFAILASAGFAWGEEPVEEDRRGLDIAVVIDVSRSMLAQDLPPSRLDQSVDTVRLVSRELPFARMAIVLFKGAATVLIPMTGDTAAIDTVLDGAGPGLVTAPGTNIAAGLQMGLERFPSASLSHRAIVLMTDGEALTGSVDEALTEIRSLGIPVFAVLVGTREGAVVPAPDGTALLDENGRPVISRADATVLVQIAGATGGEVITLSDVAAADRLVSLLDRFASVRESEGFRLVPRRRYRLFLAVALASLTVSLVVRFIRWRGMF